MDPLKFAELLPGYESNFKVISLDETVNATNFEPFSDAVFESGINLTDGYHYGSYQFYQANSETNQYKFINYLNLTSRDAAQLWPQYMYESILKVATDDPEFEYKVRSTPYPIQSSVEEFEEGLDIGTIITFMAVGFPIILAVIISNMVQERITMLKHF